MSSSEPPLRRFHTAHPGATSRALARTGTYDRLAALAGPPGTRVLDLGCGDGVLVDRLVRAGHEAVGVDVTLAELHHAGARDASIDGVDVALAERQLICARAQALPFADRAFDTVVCHLAFMLFDELDRVVAELARVLAPGGRFLAVLGGGPTATGDDAFHRFLAVAHPYLSRTKLGDPRASTPAGWAALFSTGWYEVTLERDELDLSGTIDEIWDFVGASYQLAAADHAVVRARFAAAVPPLADAAGRVPCRAVIWRASATRAREA